MDSPFSQRQLNTSSYYNKKTQYFVSYKQNTALITICMERVMGIEPTTSAWKAEVLPLNYTRIATKH